MIWRHRRSLAALVIALAALSACGHSEEEWQAKLKENQELQNQLNAEKAAHQKADSSAEPCSNQTVSGGPDRPRIASIGATQ